MDKWIKKAQKGNDRAFLKLFKKYEKDIYRIAYIYMKNEHDALDVVQETAYKAFKGIVNLKEPAYLKTWLIKITTSTAIDLIRKNSKVIQLSPEYAKLISVEDTDIPLSLSLEDLLENVTEVEKRDLILKYYYGYTFQEIAELNDMPIGTVKTTIYRALAKLRKQARRDELYEK